jgi:hypothetical protein
MTTRTILRFGATLTLVLAAAHGTAGPAAAECPWIPPFPKAEPAVRSAQEVIVGELVPASPEDLGLDPSEQGREMALRVDEVLRGPKAVGTLLDVEFLYPNWPWVKGKYTPPIPSCTYLGMGAGVGDKIALALGAVQPRQRQTVGDVSWIQPRTVYNGMTVITSPVRLAEVRRLAALPQTDFATNVLVTEPNGAAIKWLLAIIAGLVGGMKAWRRLRRYERG